MKKEDLRVGNFVIHENCQYKLTAQDIYDLHLGKPIDIYRPILLTNEYLLKVGFKDVDLQMSQANWYVKEQQGLWKQALRIAHNKNTEDWSFTLECVTPPTLSIARFKYIHELQNFYFALTGSELKYVA